MSDRVIVVLTDVEAKLVAGCFDQLAHCEQSAAAEGIAEKMDAALDTDREELVEAIARCLVKEQHGADAVTEVFGDPGTDGGAAAANFRADADAVLARIEEGANGGQ